MIIFFLNFITKEVIVEYSIIVEGKGVKYMSCNFNICSKRCHRHHHHPMPMPRSTPPAPSFRNTASAIQLVTTGNTRAATIAAPTSLTFNTTAFKIGNGINYFPNSSSIQIFQPGFYTVSYIISGRNTGKTAAAPFTATLELNGNTVSTTPSSTIAASGSDVVYASQIIYVDPQKRPSILTLSVQSADSITYNNYILTAASMTEPPQNQTGPRGQNRQSNPAPAIQPGSQSDGYPQPDRRPPFFDSPQCPPPKVPHC